MMKICLKVVRPMSKVPLEHPRTLRTGSRSADKIKKVGKEWIGSMESSYCMIKYKLNLFYLPFLVIMRVSFLSCLLYSGLCNTNIIL